MNLFGIQEVFYPTQKSDLDNSLKVILDCLQKTKTIVNDNKCVKIVAENISLIKGISFEKVADLTTKNFKNFLTSIICKSNLINQDLIERGYGFDLEKINKMSQ